MTWNPADKTSKILLSEGDLKVDLTTGTGSGAVRSRYGLSSGKWYAEFYFTSRTDNSQFVGFSNLTRTLGLYTGSDTNSWGLQLINTAFGSGLCAAYHNGASVEYADRVPGNADALVCMALDLDNKKVWWSTTQGYWTGEPTDPVSGDYALDFTGNTDTLYLEFYGSRNSSGVSSVKGLFTSDDQNGSPPTGYLPIADGWPMTYVFDSGTFALTGQQLQDTGGYLPVYQTLYAADFSLSGSAIVSTGFSWDSTNIRLDHNTVNSSLILLDPLSAYCHPDQFNTGASGYFNQLLTSGKWYLEFANLSPDYIHEHPSDAVRCGLCRGTENLSGMLGDAKTDDTYMVSFGAWNANMRYYRAGSSTAFGYVVINYNDTEGIAIDLTDPTNGKMWVHNDGTWLNGDPVTGTGGLSIVGAWYFAVSVRDKFHVLLGGTNYKPSGFTALDTETQFVTEGLWGGNSVGVDTIGTVTYTDVRLENLVGNHLLRSFVWNKRSTYYFGLLTDLDPLTEVSSSGYARLPVSASNAAWSEAFVNLQKYSQLPFNGTVVGWALFWYSTPQLYEDPVVLSRAFPTPIVCSSTEPGIAFPVGSFAWSID